MRTSLSGLLAVLCLVLLPAAAVAESVSVQVEQDAWTVADVQPQGLGVTIRVANPSPAPFQNGLLVVPAANLVDAFPQPAVVGGDAYWVVGDLPEGDTFSVQLTLDGSAEGTRLDTIRVAGVQAGGRVDAFGREVVLNGAGFPTAELRGTADVDPSDPALLAQAAVLGGDPQRILRFVQGFEHQFYEGSMHGARGALYAQAANRLDRASVLIGLLRASGVPARYVNVTLNQTEKDRLATEALAPRNGRLVAPPTLAEIRQNPSRAIDLMPARDWLALADTEPERLAAITAMDDATLSSTVFAADRPVAVQNYVDAPHVAVEAWIGGAWEHLDPSFRETTVGEVVGTAGSSFDGIAQADRHRVVLSLFHEELSPGFQTYPEFQSPTLTLSRSAGELVGKPVVVTHTTDVQQSLGLVFSGGSVTYTATLEVRDLERVDDSELLEGQPFTEVANTFAGPLGNNYVTSAWLRVELLEPGETEGDGDIELMNLADRLGYEARNGVATDSSIDFNQPATSHIDVASLLIQSSHLPERVTRTTQTMMQAAVDGTAPVIAAAEMKDPDDVPTPDELEALKLMGKELSTLFLTLHSSNMGSRKGLLQTSLEQIGYNVQPRVISGFARINKETLDADYGIDLMRERIESVGLPGTSTKNGFTFRMAYGMAASEAETAVMEIGDGQVVSAETILSAAADQDIGITYLAGQAGINFVLDPSFDVSPEARIRMRLALEDGLELLAPKSGVMVGGELRSAWFELAPDGNFLGRIDTGAGGAALFYASLAKGAICAFLPCPGRDAFMSRIAKFMGHTYGLLVFAVEAVAECAGGAYFVCDKFQSPAWQAAVDGAITSAISAFGPGEVGNGLNCSGLGFGVSAIVTTGAYVTGTQGTVLFPVKGVVSGACAYVTAYEETQNSLKGALSDPLLPASPAGIMPPNTRDARQAFAAQQRRSVAASLNQVDVAGTVSADTTTVFGSGAATYTPTTQQSWSLDGATSASAQLDVDGVVAAGALDWSGVSNTFLVDTTDSVTFDGALRSSHFSGLVDGGAAALSVGTVADSFDVSLTASTVAWRAVSGEILQVARSGQTVLAGAQTPGSQFEATGSFELTGGAAGMQGAPVAYSVTDGGVALIDASGQLSIDSATQFVQGNVVWAGGSGTVTVTPQAGAPDDVLVDLLGVEQATLTLGQTMITGFAEVAVSVDVASSLAGDFVLTAQSEPGLSVEWQGNDLHVRPQPGAAAGPRVVRVLAEGPAGLAAGDWFIYDVQPPAGDTVTMRVIENPRYTVDTDGVREAAQLLEITHVGPDSATYDLTATTDLSGLDVSLAANQVRLAPGETGRVGFTVKPQTVWPAPGTTYTTTFEAVSGATSATLDENNTVGQLSGWRVRAGEARVYLEPGVPTTVDFTFTNTGNLAATPAVRVRNNGFIAAAFSPASALVAPGSSTAVPVTLTAPALAPESLPLDRVLSVGTVATQLEIDRGVDPISAPLQVVVVAPESRDLWESFGDALDAEDWELADQVVNVRATYDYVGSNCDATTVAYLENALNGLRAVMAARGATEVVSEIDAALASIAADGCNGIDAVDAITGPLQTFAQLPDLGATLSVASPLTNGDVVDVTGGVVNNGTDEVQTVRATLELRRGLDTPTVVDTFEVGPIASGQSVPVTWSFDTSAYLGSYVFTLRVDSEQAIAERDETNNSAAVLAEVRASNAEPAGNSAPTFSSTAPTSAAVGTPFTYTPTATDPDGDLVFIDAPIRPPGIRFENGELSGEPLRPGDYDVVMVAADVWGATSTQEFVLSVASVPVSNTPPTVTSTPTRRLVADTAWTYVATATDVDAGDVVTWASVDLPAGATFTPNGATGTLDWTPVIADVGNHWVTLEAADSRGESTIHRFAVNVADTARGADLVVVDVDLSGSSTAAGSRSGSVDVTLANQGDTAATATTVELYEESDFVDGMGPGDASFGVGNVSALAAGATETVTIAVSGPVAFADNLVWAEVDPVDTVVESDEDNNTRHSAQLDEPLVGTYVGVQDRESELILLAREATTFQVIDPTTNLVLAEGDLAALTPTAVPVEYDDAGTPTPLLDVFVVQADAPVQAYLTHEIFVDDFGGDFFHQDVTGNRVGREFVLYAPTQTVNNRLIVVALENTQLTLTDAMGSTIASLGLIAGQAWEPQGITAGTAYNLMSTGDVVVQSSSVTGMSIVPPADRSLAAAGDVGTEFRFNVRARGPNGGAFAVFGYEDANYTVYREDGSTMATGSADAGDQDFQTGFGNQNGLYLVADAPVSVVGGDISRAGATSIDFMGEDITQTVGSLGRDIIAYTFQNDGGDSVVIAGPAGAALDVDGVSASLGPFEKLVLTDSTTVELHASAPVVAQLFGGGDRYFDQGELLRAFPTAVPEPAAQLDSVSFTTATCATDVVVSLRVGNRGSGVMSSGTTIELVELGANGEVVLATETLGTELVPGDWVDRTVAGTSAAASGVARSWMVRLVDGSNRVLAWSAGPSGFAQSTCTNGAPTFTSTPPSMATEGDLLDYQATATDPDGDALTFAILAGPGAATTTPQGRLTWTVGAVDTASFVLAVEDTAGNVALQAFDVAVTRAPDGCTGTDADADGFCVPQDCDDTDPNRNPGTPEILGNGLDDDCSPATADVVSPASISFDIFSQSPTYGAYDVVRLGHRVRNLSPIQALGLVTAQTTVECDGQAPAELDVMVEVGPVGAASSVTAVEAWQLAGAFTGTCSVESTLRGGSVELARAQTSFQIGTNLLGTLQASTDSVVRGQPVSLDWSAENPGDLEVTADLTIDAQGIAPLESRPETLAAGANVMDTTTVDTTSLTPGLYTFQLKANGVPIAYALVSVEDELFLGAPAVPTATDPMFGDIVGAPLRYQPLGPVDGARPSGGILKAAWSDDGLVLELSRTDTTSDGGDSMLIRLAAEGTLIGSAQWVRNAGASATIGTVELVEGDQLSMRWTLSPEEAGGLSVGEQFGLMASVRDGDGNVPRGAWTWSEGVNETLDDPATFGILELLADDTQPPNNNTGNNAANNNTGNNAANNNTGNNMTGNNGTSGNNETGGNGPSGADDEGCGCASSGSTPQPGGLFLAAILGLFALRRRALRLISTRTAKAAPVLLALMLVACGDDTTNTPGGGNNTLVDGGGTDAQTSGGGDAGEADAGGTDTDAGDSDAGDIDAGDETTGTVGDPCETDADCDSGQCLTGPEYSVCTRACDVLDCEDGWTCERFPGGGEACVPANICVDNDGDGYGAGRACMGPDCNDDNPNQNPGATEACNGVDDNCDGQADEELLNACGTCGALPAEVCNGVDDDCDGNIDDGVLNACGTCGVVPVEVCNGLDDDCNGDVDDGVCGNRCAEGTTRSCYEGPPGTDGQGVCAAGTETCVNGAWSECTGQTLPDAEVCDSDDNDCDGDVDENLTNSCGTCGAAPREICNGIDDDCDGQIDEGALNRCGTCGPCGEAQIFPGESGFGDPTIAPAPDGGITLGQGSISRDSIWVPNSDEDTASRWNTRTGREETRMWIGENPSRTSVDLLGNAWVAHRGDGKASYIIANTADCIDRNNDGVIQTSRDLNGDGRITGGEVVNSPTDPFADECLKCQVQVSSPTDLVRGVAVDRNNDAWFGTWNGRSVVRVDDDCNVLNTIDTGRPVYGVVIDSQGRLFTSTFTNNCVNEIDTATATLTATHCAPGGTRYGLAIDGNNDVWYADYGSGVWQFEPDTQTWTQHVYNAATGSLAQSTGMVVGLDGSVYVAGYNSNTIGKFRPSTGEWESFSYRNAATGMLDQRNVRGVTIDAEGNLWGIARGSSGLIKMRPDGVPLASYDIVNYQNPSTGVGPYSYSDNTGFQLLNYTANEGTWRNIFDAGQFVRFRELTWTEFLPPGASVEVRVRASADRSTLDQQTWTAFQASSPVDLFNLVADDMRYLEMEFELTSSSPSGRPVIRDIQVFFETDDCRDPANPCPGGQVCDTIQGGCIVVPTQCTDDTACAGDEYCDASGVCRFGCRLPNNCQAGQTCEPNLRRCEDRNKDCLLDSDCSFDSYCSANQYCEQGCRTSPDNCPVGFECNASTNACDPLPPECALDTDCPSGEYCDSGRCASGCRVGDATTCSTGEICEADSHTCVVPPATCDPQNVTAEVCNGFDDNCDGTVDEGTSTGNTCVVGDSGATGNEVCYEGRVLCRATPSNDASMPVVLSGTLTDVLLPAGEYSVSTDLVASGYVRVDDGARIQSTNTAGNLLVLASSDVLDVGQAVTIGIGYQLNFNSLTIMRGTTLIGSDDGARGVYGQGGAEFNIRDGRVTNMAVNVVNVFAEFTRFEATDQRTRWLLELRGNGYVGDNVFVGTNLVPRVQSGIWARTGTNMIRDNRLEYLSTAIRVDATAEIYENTINDPDIGIDIWNWAAVTSDGNTIDMNDVALVSTGVRFQSYRGDIAAVVTNTSIVGEPSDAGVILDPDVFHEGNEAEFTGTTVTGLLPERSWTVTGDGNGHENIVDLSILPGVTDLWLTGNVRQFGGSLTIDSTVPVKSLRPEFDWYIEGTFGATLDIRDTTIDDIRIVNRNSGTFDNLTMRYSRDRVNRALIYNQGTATISNSSLTSTAVLNNVDQRIHRGVQSNNGTTTVTNCTFTSLEWGAYATGTGLLSVSGSTFYDNNAGIVAQNDGRLDPLTGNTFRDDKPSRVVYGIIMLDTRAGAALNIQSATFDIGPEDIPIALTPNEFETGDTATITNLTYVNGEQGEGVVLRGDQYVADATITPIAGDSTLRLYDQDFDVRNGNTMTVKNGVTLVGTDNTIRLLRVYGVGSTLNIEPGVVFEDVTIQPLDAGTANVDGATFQVSANSRSRNYMSAGRSSFLNASNVTMVGRASPKNVGGIHVWNGATATITDVDGTDLDYGVWTERDSVTTVTGGVYDGCDRVFDVRRNSDITMSGVTLSDFDSTYASTGLWTETLEGGLSIDWSTMTFDIGPEDIPFELEWNTFLDTQTLAFSGTTFTGGETGEGWLVRATNIYGGTFDLRMLEPVQPTWKLSGNDTYFRNSSILNIPAGVRLQPRGGDYDDLWMLDSTTLNLGGETENIRVNVYESAAATIDGATVELSLDVTYTLGAIPINSTGPVTVQNSTVRALGPAIGEHVGINVWGVGVVPTISNNTVEGFDICIQNALDSTPTVSGTTYVGCTTDFQQN